MRKLLNIFGIIAVTAFLGACSGVFETADQLDIDGAETARESGAEASYSPFNWRPQEFAGMTGMRMIYPQNKDDPVVVEMLSGKEAAGAQVTFATPDGSVITYDATGLQAFEGQLARAEVEKALAEQYADLIEVLGQEGFDALVDTVCAVATGGACLATGGLVSN